MAAEIVSTNKFSGLKNFAENAGIDNQLNTLISRLAELGIVNDQILKAQDANDLAPKLGLSVELVRGLMASLEGEKTSTDSSLQQVMIESIALPAMPISELLKMYEPTNIECRARELLIEKLAQQGLASAAITAFGIEDNQYSPEVSQSLYRAARQGDMPLAIATDSEGNKYRTFRVGVVPGQERLLHPITGESLRMDGKSRDHQLDYSRQVISDEAFHVLSIAADLDELDDSLNRFEERKYYDLARDKDRLNDLLDCFSDEVQRRYADECARGVKPNRYATDRTEALSDEDFADSSIRSFHRRDY
ncbi:MAG: hypothetical protein KDD62_14185 [Bdellovibrionales bacterium]|nr:hypothetical protein [Bdellovibrionales bacterium]